jgi:hypothetical protein
LALIIIFTNFSEIIWYTYRFIPKEITGDILELLNDVKKQLDVDDAFQTEYKQSMKLADLRKKTTSRWQIAYG